MIPAVPSPVQLSDRLMFLFKTRVPGGGLVDIAGRVSGAPTRGPSGRAVLTHIHMEASRVSLSDQKAYRGGCIQYIPRSPLLTILHRKDTS